MSFFPRSFITAHDAAPSSFHPLFRLLDDFDQYSRKTDSVSNTKHSQPVMKSFTPKFDVKEVGDFYELHGDLPGIEQKDVELEFTDAQTLTVRGRVESQYTSPREGEQSLTSPGSFSSNNAQPVEDASSAAKAVEDTPSAKEHQPSVEDEDASQALAANSTSTQVAQASQSKAPEPRYWVSERSVGEFARSFTFPVRVDQEAVRASMKNGVLSVVVPKSKKSEARKIAIN